MSVVHFRKYKGIIIILTAIIIACDLVFFLGYDFGQQSKRVHRRPTKSVHRPQDSSISHAIKHKGIEETCRRIPPEKYSDWTRIPGYFMDPTRDLSYCLMQYDMDDVWARIFDMLLNSSRAADYLKKPFPKLQKTEMVKSLERNLYKIIIFVRNPFTHLYVAYHDRFNIVPGHDKQQTWCEKITFQEILDKTISHVKLRQDLGITWFSPLVPKCRLCDGQSFIVVKEENLTQDMKELSRKLFKNDEDFLNVLELIQKPRIFIHSLVLAKLNYRNPSCIHMYKNVSQTLWKSLQFNGYIRSSVKYPESLDNADVSFHPHILVDPVLNADDKFPSETEILAQRHTILAEAYRDIKDETIEYIQEIYKYDFEMFGYSNLRPKL